MKKFFSLITAFVLCTAMWGDTYKTFYKVQGALYQGINVDFTTNKNMFVPNGATVTYSTFDGKPADWYNNGNLKKSGVSSYTASNLADGNYYKYQIKNYTGYDAQDPKIDYMYGTVDNKSYFLRAGSGTMYMMSMANAYCVCTESSTASNVGKYYVDNRSMLTLGATDAKTYGTSMKYGTNFSYAKNGGLIFAYEMLVDNPGEMYIDYIVLPIFGYPKSNETTIEKMIPEGAKLTLTLYPIDLTLSDEGIYSYTRKTPAITTVTATAENFKQGDKVYDGTVMFDLKDKPVLISGDFVARLTWDDGCEFGLITDDNNLQNFTTFYLWKDEEGKITKSYFWGSTSANASISYHAMFPVLEKKDTKTALEFTHEGGGDEVAIKSNIDPASKDFTIDFGGATWVSLDSLRYTTEGEYKAKETVYVVFKAEANTGEAREATITLKHHGKVLTYTVSQEAAPAPVEPTYLYLKAGEVDYMKDGAVVYLYSWGGSSEADWSKFELIQNETTAKASMMKDRTGMKIVRFASGTKTPSWEGTIWNQTGDIAVSSDFSEKVDMIELSAWDGATTATWSKYVKPEVKYYLKNNWDNGEWSWKEMKLDEEVYVLDRVVFGGTGVNLNTAKSDEGSKWFDLKSLKYNDEDTIQALDTVRFELAISEKDTVLTAIVLARPTPPCTPNFGVMVDDTVYQKGTFNETDNQWEVKGVSLTEDQALTLYNLCEETAFMPKAGNFGEVFDVDAKAMIVKETAIYDFYIKLIADADELWVVKHNVEVLPQITEAPKSWAGEYVITAMKNNDTALVWTGIDAGQCRVETPVVEGEVTMTDPVKVIVEAMNGGGYSIKVKGGTNDGKYLTQKAKPDYNNALSFVDSPVRVDIEMNDKGLVDIYQTINATQKVYLLYNAQSGSTNERFRFYKGANYGGANYKSLTLFGTVAPVMNYDTTMYVAGNFTDWQNEMIELPAKVDFPADSTLEFKQVRVITTTDEGGKVVKQDTTWYGQAGEGNFMTRESNAWLLDGTNNVFAKTDVEGTYTFSINEKGEFVITWPITYYLKNNWNGGEWSWKEMKADEEVYVLDSVVFGGTGVNLNTAKSDEGFKWFDLKSLKYNDEDTIQALDTVRFELAISEKDTVLTAILLGRPAPAARKEFVFVAGAAAEANPAMFAITWGKDGSNETVKLANKADDIYTAEILETVDSLVLVRCASDAAEIIWDGEGKNVWNQTDNYAICDTMYFKAWVDGSNKFIITCDAPKPVEVKYFLKNNWNGAAEWSWKEMTKKEEAYVLDSVIFGGTGVNLNTKEDDADAVWFDLDKLTYNEKDTIQALDTVRFELAISEKDTVLKAIIIGRPAPAPRKEFTFIAGEVAESNPTLFAITWGKDGSNETVKLANKADDIYAAEILETIDSLVLVRCASDAAEIIWDGEGKNVWNQTDNYAICDTMSFVAWVDGSNRFTIECYTPQPAEVLPQIIEAPKSWAGEYVITAMKDENTALVWTGVDAGQCRVEAPVAGNKLTNNDFVKVIVEALQEGGYSIKVKGGTNDGKYITQKAKPDYNNALSFVTTPVRVDIEMNDKGLVDIYQTINATQKVYLLYNAQSGSTNERFRFYKGTNHGQSNYYSLTLFGTVAPEPPARKAFVFVAGAAAEADPALFAITWGKDGSNETVKLANKEADIYTAEILETVDSVVLVRCATGATEIIWDGEGKNVWNQTANYALCDTMYFGEWTEEGLFTLTCEAPKPVEVKYFAKNNWNCAKDEEGKEKWSWLELVPSTVDDVYMLDTIVFGGTGVNVNDKADDAGAIFIAANKIVVLNGLDGIPTPYIPEPRKRDTVLWAPRHSGIVLEAPQLQSGDTIKLFFNAADSTLKAFIVGRPAPAARKEFVFVAGEAAEANPAMFAITWGKDGSNETVKMTQKGEEALYAADILATVDSVVLVRCATGATEIIWDGEGMNVWNQTANYELCDTMYFESWVPETNLFAVTCEAPKPVETKYYAKNNWNGGEWSWLEMSATTQENVYMLDSVVFGGTGVNINDKEDDTDALWFAADAITVLDGLDGLPGPIPPEPRKRDTIPYAPAHSGVVLEAPQLLAGDTIKLFFNAADSTLKAFIVGRPEQPQPAEVKYYVTGNAALVGEDNAWKAQAIEMIDSTYTFTELAAGEYEMKITNGAWDPEGQSWGSAALSEECSAGVGDKDGNIHFIVETANDVTVSIANGSVTVTGTFKQVATGITVNVTVPEGTPACFFYGEMSGNTFVEMTKVDDTHYTKEFPKATSIGWGYKFVWENGNWSTCNADPEGDIKVEPVEGVINVEVKAWATAPGTEYKYTTYTEWQVKFGPAWEWVNMTKQEDGTFTVEAVWGNTGINIASGENPIKQDWYALDDPALTVEEDVVEGDNVVITLTVVDDETVALNVAKGETPQPVETKYYITGNEALCGEKAWNAQAIEMIDSTYTFTELAAGEYEMKITNGAWDPEGQSWGSAALSEECSAGVGDKDGNIHFIVETPNNVVVSIANGKVTVTGTFKEEPVTAGITVNVTVPEGTPACFFYGEMSGNTFVEMTKVDDTHYTKEFPKATSIGWGYKFVWENGNWSTCNADPEGDIKVEPVEGVINVEVKAWATAPGTEYKYTTYTEWQVKFGPAWEWVNMTKQEDGTFTVEAVWGNTGINIASGENPIKQDWFPLDDPALTVEEGVVEGGNVVITLTVVDDETVALNVAKGQEPATPDFGLLVNGTNYLAGTPEDKDTYTEYAVSTTLAIGDFVQLYDNVAKAAWTVEPEGEGFTDFDIHDGAYYIKQAGLYQFYIKIPKQGMESGLYVGFQTGTNLNNVKALNGKRYNILGQPVNETYRGIVIMNGQTYLQ